MSLPALQNDSNVPTSKVNGSGDAYHLGIAYVHKSGASDGTADGTWSYGVNYPAWIKYEFSTKKWIDLAESQPSKVSDTWDVDTTAVSGSSTGSNPLEVFLWNSNGGQFLGKFSNPFYQATNNNNNNNNNNTTTPVVIKTIDNTPTTPPNSDPAAWYAQWYVENGQHYVLVLVSQTSNLSFLNVVPLLKDKFSGVNTSVSTTKVDQTSSIVVLFEVEENQVRENFVQVYDSSSGSNVLIGSFDFYERRKVSCNFW